MTKDEKIVLVLFLILFALVACAYSALFVWVGWP